MPRLEGGGIVGQSPGKGNVRVAQSDEQTSKQPSRDDPNRIAFEVVISRLGAPDTCYPGRSISRIGSRRGSKRALRWVASVLEAPKNALRYRRSIEEKRPLCSSQQPEDQSKHAGTSQTERCDDEIVRPVRNQGQSSPGSRGEEPVRVLDDGRTITIKNLEEVARMADGADDEEMAFPLHPDEQQDRSLDRGAALGQNNCVEIEAATTCPFAKLPKGMPFRAGNTDHRGELIEIGGPTC
jgi:hypothetical protein